MPAFICTACGTQYPDSAQAPSQCRICEEERQYVPEAGQGWTTLEALAKSHVNQFREYEPGVTGIGAGFAIGQRALLLQTPGGNILWDCVATLNDATVSAIKAKGGLKAIAISHPHFYTAMGEWARAFDCPIHLHAADKDWIVNPSPAVQLWDGETHRLWDGVTLIRCGGHFEGGTVLHWQEAKQPRASSAPATFSPSPPTANGCPSCAAIRISFRSRCARSAASTRRSRLSPSTRFTAIISTASLPQTPNMCWSARSRAISRR